MKTYSYCLIFSGKGWVFQRLKGGLGASSIPFTGHPEGICQRLRRDLFAGLSNEFTIAMMLEAAGVR